MQEKLIIVAVVLGFALVGLLGQNVMQKQQVVTALNDILSPSNTHTFKDRTGLENEIWDRIEAVVGEDAEVEVELYHYQGRVSIQDWNGIIPRYGGVKKEGGSLVLSSLLCRVWWTQTILGKNPRDVHVVKALFVEPLVVGGAYSPPPKDFDEVQDPILLLEAAE